MSEFQNLVNGQIPQPPLKNGNNLTLKVYGLNLDTLPYNNNEKLFKYKESAVSQTTVSQQTSNNQTFGLND